MQFFVFPLSSLQMQMRIGPLLKPHLSAGGRVKKGKDKAYMQTASVFFVLDSQLLF